MKEHRKSRNIIRHFKVTKQQYRSFYWLSSRPTHK